MKPMRNLESKCDRAYAVLGKMELALAHVRYETLRKLSPLRFHELYNRSMTDSIPFDDLVDMLADEKPTY